MIGRNGFKPLFCINKIENDEPGRVLLMARDFLPVAKLTQPFSRSGARVNRDLSRT